MRFIFKLAIAWCAAGIGALLVIILSGYLTELTGSGDDVPLSVEDASSVAVQTQTQTKTQTQQRHLSSSTKNHNIAIDHIKIVLFNTFPDTFQDAFKDASMNKAISMPIMEIDNFKESLQGHLIFLALPFEPREFLQGQDSGMGTMHRLINPVRMQQVLSNKLKRVLDSSICTEIALCIGVSHYPMEQVLLNSTEHIKALGRALQETGIKSLLLLSDYTTQKKTYLARTFEKYHVRVLFPDAILSNKLTGKQAEAKLLERSRLTAIDGSSRFAPLSLWQPSSSNKIEKAMPMVSTNAR